MHCHVTPAFPHISTPPPRENLSFASLESHILTQRRKKEHEKLKAQFASFCPQDHDNPSPSNAAQLTHTHTIPTHSSWARPDSHHLFTADVDHGDKTFSLRAVHIEGSAVRIYGTRARVREPPSLGSASPSQKLHTQGPLSLLQKEPIADKPALDKTCAYSVGHTYDESISSSSSVSDAVPPQPAIVSPDSSLNTTRDAARAMRAITLARHADRDADRPPNKDAHKDAYSDADNDPDNNANNDPDNNLDPKGRPSPPSESPSPSQNTLSSSMLSSSIEPHPPFALLATCSLPGPPVYSQKLDSALFISICASGQIHIADIHDGSLFASASVGHSILHAWPIVHTPYFVVTDATAFSLFDSLSLSTSQLSDTVTVNTLGRADPGMSCFIASDHDWVSFFSYSPAGALTKDSLVLTPTDLRLADSSAPPESFPALHSPARITSVHTVAANPRSNEQDLILGVGPRTLVLLWPQSPHAALVSADGIRLVACSKSHVALATTTELLIFAIRDATFVELLREQMHGASALSIHDGLCLFLTASEQSLRLTTWDLQSLHSSQDSIPISLHGTSTHPTPTAYALIDNESALVGYSNGTVSHVSFNKALASASSTRLDPVLCVPSAPSTIAYFDDRTLAVIATVRGTVHTFTRSAQNAWDSLGSWHLFPAAIRHIVPISTHTRFYIAFESNAMLTLLPISQGPAAVPMSLLGMESQVALIAMHESDELLVAYEQGLARVWELPSRQLRRSIDVSTCRSLLAQPGWTLWYLRDGRDGGMGITTHIMPHVAPPPSAFLPVDLPRLCSSESRTALESYSLFLLKSLLASTGSFASLKGISKQLEHLYARTDAASTSSLLLMDGVLCRNAWHVSPRVTAWRLVILVSLTLSLSASTPSAAALPNHVIEFAKRIPAFAVPPALDVLARHWVDPCAQVRHAAQTLFRHFVREPPIAAIEPLLFRFSALLAAEAPRTRVHALLVVGLLCISRNDLVPPFGTLRRLSLLLVDLLDDSITDKPCISPFLPENIALESTGKTHALAGAAVDPEPGPSQVGIAAAIDLAARGLHIWVLHVDAVHLLKKLIAIATAQLFDENGLVLDSQPSQTALSARHACLSIAKANTPLFVTTLLVDIADTHSPQDTIRSLIFVGLAVKQQPDVIYPSLPRVADTVIRALDPSQHAKRSIIISAVSLAIRRLVDTYPCVAFNKETQRLAVGGADGAVVVYDVHAGTRLYVLESYHLPVSALSWAPNGKRLVTVSLAQGLVNVWKMGASFLSFLTPGAPPRQSRLLSLDIEANRPYMQLSFERVEGDSGTMSFEWQDSSDVVMYIDAQRFMELSV